MSLFDPGSVTVSRYRYQGRLGGTAYLDGLSLDDGYHIRVESLRDLVAACNREVAMLERVIHQRLRDDPGYVAIQAIDGVGRVLGAIFVAEAGDVSRFPNPQALCSGAGLTPKHRESDTKAHRGRITKTGSTLVRWAAIEAISKMRGGPKLKADYMAIASRRGVNVARVAVARKLLNGHSQGASSGGMTPSRWRGRECD